MSDHPSTEFRRAAAPARCRRTAELPGGAVKFGTLSIEIFTSREDLFHAAFFVSSSGFALRTASRAWILIRASADTW